MRLRWLTMVLVYGLLAGCSEPGTHAGFAGLGGTAGTDNGFEQPGPGTELVFPGTSALIRPIASNGGTSPQTWKRTPANHWGCSGPSSARPSSPGIMHPRHRSPRAGH